MAEYVIRVVIDASGVRPAISKTSADVDKVGKSAEGAGRKLKQAKTEAELLATSLAKMASASNTMRAVPDSLVQTLRAGRVQAEDFTSALVKTKTAAMAGLAVADKGLERQLKKSQSEAQKLAADLIRVSKAAQNSLAATRGGGLDRMLRAGRDAVTSKPAGPSKEDRAWATAIYENSTGAQNKLMARTAIGANLAKTRTEADALAASLGKAAKTGDDLGSSLGRIAAIAAAGALSALIAGVVTLSDEYTVLQNKLRTVTDGSEELNVKTEETFALAQRLRSEWGATAQVYGRIRRSTEQLGLSEDQVLTITENLTKAIKVSGSTANETKSVLLQLGQAFGSGKLNGDEFRSVMENATEVGNVLAASLGVTRGELKGLSSAGRLTSEVLAKAFLAPNKVFGEFSQMVPTFAERFTMLRNAATKAIGEWAKSSSLMSALGKSIEFAANHVDVLIRVATAFGVLLTGALVAYAIPKAIAAFHALTAAMLANPWVAAATAISVLVVAISGLGDEVEEVDRKLLGSAIAGGPETMLKLSAAQWEEYKKVLSEAEAAALKFQKSMQEVFDEIQHGNSLLGQMEARLKGAFAGVDVFKSIQKVQLDTVAPLIDAVTTSTLKNIDRLVAKAKEAAAAFQALKRETEALQKAANPIAGQVLEWNEAEKTLGRALRAKIITLEEQKALLDATFDRIFEAPRTTASDAIFANSDELAKTAIQRDELLTQMGEEQAAAAEAEKTYLRMDPVLRDLAEAIDVANAAFAAGRLHISDYEDAIRHAELAVVAAENGTRSLEYGIASGFEALRDQATDVAGAMEAAFTNAYAGIESALVDLVVTGKTDFKGLVDSMLGDLTRVLARLAFTSLLAGDYGKAAAAGGAVGAGGLISALGGLRTGGQFRVGGSGGPDSQVVAFRATPNETVSVTTPSQGAKGNFGTGQAPVVNIYNVMDQREVSAIDTPAGGRAINNVLRKNPQLVRSRNR